MRRLAIFCLAVTTSACGGGGGGESSGPATIDPDIQIDLWNVAGVVGNAASVAVHLGNSGSRSTIVNVVADLNGDGTIAPYAGSNGMQDEWLVQNVPVLTIDKRFALGFELNDTALAGASKVPVRVTTGTSEVASAPGLASTNGDGSLHADATIRVRMLKSFTPPPPGFAGQGQVMDYNTEWMTESTPSTSSDSTFYRSHLAEAPPGINNCVPGTVAANLANLGARDGWSDGLRETPDSAPFGTNTNEGLQGLQDQLTRMSDEWNWSSDRGVKLNKIVDGKKEITDKMGLPVTTMFIAAGPDINIPVAIQENLLDGCAVELIMSIPSTTGGDPAGHMVGVAGYVQKKGINYFIIRDGLTPTLNDAYRMTNEGSIPGYQQGGKRVGAGAIGLVVECTQKVQAVKLNYPHGDLKAGDVVHMRCITGGHVGTGADCSYAHYHATISTITGHGGPYEDKFENGCGHGAVVEVLPKELTVKCFGPQK